MPPEFDQGDAGSTAEGSENEPLEPTCHPAPSASEPPSQPQKLASPETGAEAGRSGARTGPRRSRGTAQPKSALIDQPPGRAFNGHSLVSALSQSQLCTEFRQAFSEATGLPVALQPIHSWGLPHRGSKYENPFCALMVERSRTCVWCLQSHERLWEGAMAGYKSAPCIFGLWEMAVAVRLDSEVIGFLHSGQAFQQPPTPAQFDRIQRFIVKAAPDVPLDRARALWFNSPVVGPERWAALTALLRIFGEHLSLVSRQLALQAQYAEPPSITRARQFLEANYTERLSLSAVARVAHMSPFYFCKLFKRVTGLNYTDYLARLRVDKARNLLLNPNLKISEIAFEVGFQSLTHFNRMFKRLSGQAPSEYRRRLSADARPQA